MPAEERGGDDVSWVESGGWGGRASITVGVGSGACVVAGLRAW